MTTTPELLTEDAILRIVRDNVSGDTLRLKRDVGPYEVTEPTPQFLRLVRALEAAVRAALSTHTAQAAEPAKPDGKLHDDGYFTWNTSKHQPWTRPAPLPCDFWLTPQPATHTAQQAEARPTTE